jgi:hypothetical protein
MPEQLTKHPEITLQVLRSTGAKCGEGAEQQILVKCPAQRFCKLPGGEVCVYGLAEAPSMTQITATDWRALQVSLKEPIPARHNVPLGTMLIAISVALALGWFLHRAWGHHEQRKELRRRTAAQASGGEPP